jgi:hypothetical protein
MRWQGSYWRDLGCALLLALLGCKSGQPDLRPAVQKEVLNSPPDESRYNSSAIPKQAMLDNSDPSKRYGVTGPGASMTNLGGPGGAGGMGRGMGGMGGGMGGAPGGVGGFGR